MLKEEKVLFPRIAETEKFAAGNKPPPVNNTLSVPRYQ